MNFTFENQGTNTYLVYAIGAEDSIDSMSLGMLTNNKIPGLAPAIFTQMDTNKYIKYNVSAHISVKQFFSGPVNKKRLIGVFNGIVDAMLSAEDYMIDVNTILMDLDYIFADVSTCETVLICLPLVDTESAGVDLSAFFKNIMFSTQFDQTENCDHVAKIMNYLNSTPIFSLTDFKELLRSIDTPAAPAAQPVVKPQPVATPAPQPAKAEQPKVTPPQPQPAVAPAPVAKPAAQPVATPPVKTQPAATPVQVPPVQTTPVNKPVAAAPAAPEKKMSMMDLLMHYNKENAAIYKAQKEAAKGAASAAAPAPQKPVKQNAAPAANAGFAIPGQPTPPPAAANKGFAIPGQPTPPPAPANKGFAIPGQPAPAVTVAQPAVTPAPAAKPVAQPVATPAPQPQYQAPVTPPSQPMSFGETTVLGGGANIGETTVLGAAPTATQPKPHLVRTKNNEKINLDKPVFRIGKEKSYVDYFIGDNPAISRSHSNFITRENEYFVVDTNSTNHTYVNGAMIQSNVETKLSHGDKVRLANEDFEFRLF